MATALLLVGFLTPDNHLYAEDIEGQIRWNLNDIFENESDWHQTKAKVEEDIENLTSFEGKLNNDPATILLALNTISQINEKAARVFIYASLNANEDMRDANSRAMLNSALELFTALEQATTFVAPEVRVIGQETVDRWIAQTPELSKHAFRLKDIFLYASNAKPETAALLAQEEKTILEAQQAYRNTVGKSILWPWVTLDSGQGITLNPDTYARYRGINNRADRKNIFDAFWQSWRSYETNVGRILSTVVKSHVSSAKIRGFDNALSQAMSGPRLPTEVYSSLIQSANDNLPSLHRYLKLRERMLGITNSHYYDIYPATTYQEQRFTLEEAKDITLQALVPYGIDYIANLTSGFDEQWMHVYPQPGKQSGAYTQNAGYDIHPYILLNYNRRFDGVSTFAHEWGHAVHALFSRQNNDFETYSYNPFVGELAAASNEVLLQEFMLFQDLSDEDYLYYIDQALEGIRASFFRQTMFAEFELRIHEIAEAGEELSGKRFSEIYLKILKKYHGHDQGIMTIDPSYAIEWAYIPHFYSNFYVYQNATSIVGGTMFANRLLAGNKVTKDNYIALLKAGGSDYPHALLTKAGVDLTTSAPYEALMTRMARLMDAADVILDRMGK
ncbi:M3 family oligoendopeptidase [Kordiimonas aquimaris]|uniref:M3 family oligoendopeptidase n=1 Tax=Kordiimonas aquimaris TaxID=707591 RepID=UPI0021D147F8|nr:M3 family oligoendopeptidase [Kordiimonas aquimaris]